MSSWTLPAHLSMLTSLDPGAHGGVDHEHRADPARATLPGALRAAGYATHAVTSHLYVSRAYGLEGPAFRLDVIAPGSTAEAAGLKAGDLLTEIGGERVTSEREATNHIAASRPGDRVRLRVVRAGGEIFETEAVLEERPQQDGT